MSKARPKPFDPDVAYRWHEGWTIDVTDLTAVHKSGLVFDFFVSPGSVLGAPFEGVAVSFDTWRGTLRGGLPPKARRERLIRLAREASVIFNYEATFICMDCLVNTSAIDEYYMVVPRVWSQATPTDPGGNGMLCLDCLERRIRRPLVALDFTHAPINNSCQRVERLRRTSTK